MARCGLMPRILAHSAPRGFLQAEAAQQLCYSGLRLALLLGGIELSLGCSESPLLPPPSNTSNPEPLASGQTEMNPSVPNATLKDAAAPTRCEIPRVRFDGAPALFRSLSARVLDEKSSPITRTTAQACGSDVCLPGHTDAQGKVLIDTEQPLRNAAFKYGDGLLVAQFALPLKDGPDYVLGDQLTTRFPELSKAVRLVAGSTSTSSDAELQVTEDTNVAFDELDFPEETQHVFVARSIEANHFPEVAKREGNLEILWALGPLKTKLCPAAKLRVPNLTALASGSAVEFLLHVTDSAGEWGSYGSFARVALGHVTADGIALETDVDSGIPQLGVLGIRLVNSPVK